MTRTHLLTPSALALALLAAQSAQATTYYVRNRGSDRAAGTTPATAFTTIVRAAQALQLGDSIVIGPGVYHESAAFAEKWGTAAAPISIIGDESGKRTGDEPGRVVIQAANQSDPALSFYRMQHLLISGLTLGDRVLAPRGPGQGLQLDHCSDVTVQRMTFDSLSKGLTASNIQDLRVESSVFAGCTVAASFQNDIRTRLAHLTVASSSSVGLLILSCGEGSIRNCIFANNSAAFVTDEGSAPVWSSDHNALAGPTGPWGPVPIINNIYEWNAASDQDRHSVYVIPGFADPDGPDLHIDPHVRWAGGSPGAETGIPLTPAVTADRDGNPFRAHNGALPVGAYNYPEPQADGAWRKLNAALPAGGPRQSAAVYNPDGSLVRTLLADAYGVRDLWWDGLDDQGQPAPAGAYQVRSISHDVRLLDDGNVGDNGNPRSVYNPDNVDRVAVMPDGSFFATAVYDEAGMTLRHFSASGAGIFASNLDEGGFWGLSNDGDDLIGGRGDGQDAMIVRLVNPGVRAPMATGEKNYKILTADEKTGKPVGLVVSNGTAFVSIAGLDVVRAIDLTTGKKVGDLPVPTVGDISRYEAGEIEALSGKNIVDLSVIRLPDGRHMVTFTDPPATNAGVPTGLDAPLYLATWGGKTVVVDRQNNRLSFFYHDHPHVILGRDRTKDYWTPVQPDNYRDPRGAAFEPDGRLILTESGRIRIFWPENPKGSVDLVSDFVDTGVVHPLFPNILYTGLGIYRVDPQTGKWTWLVETAPLAYTAKKPEDDPFFNKRPGMPATAVVLDGRPFLAFLFGGSTLQLYDISDPMQPRLALTRNDVPAIYSMMAFSKGGDIVISGQQTLSFRVVRYKGLDADKNPIFNWDHPDTVGPKTDPIVARGMTQKGGVATDRLTGDIYHMAVTTAYNKMVPGWGADATGLGKSTPDGKPLWFSLSSGGNYVSMSAASDAKHTWILGCKSFGGQADVFTPDGLRVTTGNWSWPTHYSIGFVDVRYGLNAYLRPNGKVGAYVEDDAIGRLARYRLDGSETLQSRTSPFTWNGGGGAAGAIPIVDRVGGKGLPRLLVVRKVAPMTVDGDWSQWEKAGVTPQMIALPSSIGYKRIAADDLLRTFREGTLIGAIAHDDKNFYAYFVIADDTRRFDAVNPALIWEYDSLEIWMEEEQFGAGILADGTPDLYKLRFHDKAGTQWKGSYPLPRENVWAATIDDLSKHPLGRQLAAITGVPFDGKPGYAVMVKIPFEEVKLVGGIAGRGGDQILNMTGQPGEIVRIALGLNNVSAWGRVQDYQVDWPVGKMFSDPTRSFPFVLE